MTSVDLETLRERMRDAEAACTEWEHHVHRTFSGVDACRVLMMHAYHLDLSIVSDTLRYESWLNKDPTGKMLETAMRGVNLYLHARSLHQQILAFHTELSA